MRDLLTPEEVQEMAERNQKLNMLRARESGPGTALCFAFLGCFFLWAWFWL